MGPTFRDRYNKVEMLTGASINCRFPNLPEEVDICSMFLHNDSLMVCGARRLVNDKHSKCYQLTKGTWKQHSLTKRPRSWTSVVTTDKG